MDFIAVDFETPNRHNDTICSMGITFVENSEIVFNRNILINPECFFDDFNTTLHGISEQDVFYSPTFSQVWSEYESYFKHYPIVMHNADFDTSVLYKAAHASGIDLPPMDFYCTKCLCKANYKLEKYSLNRICEHFCLNLNHHDSGSDSLCTARIMLSLLADKNASIFIHMPYTQFKEKADAYASKVSKSRRAVSCFDHINRNPETRPSDTCYEKPDCHYSDCDISFEGKRFVLTGMFPHYSRSAATRYIEQHGGKVSSAVSSKTDYLVIGAEDKNVVGPDGKSTKIERAEELIAHGVDTLYLVDACRFVELIKNKNG